MPAPLGKTPTRKMPNIEVFGLEDSPETRAAIRFFRERRIVVRFTDLRKKPLVVDELRGFVDRLGASALESPAVLDAPGLIARLRADPALLRLPLVRYGNDVTAGKAETTWKLWLGSAKR